MKIGYIDLNFTSFYEDYSLKPARYGGGRVFASWCKEFFDFYIFGCPETFDNVSSREAGDKCISLTPQQMIALVNGVPLKDIAPDFHDIDLFIYPHTNTILNLEGLKAKQAVWSVGVEEPIHSRHEHLLLYNDFQKPKIQNPNTKIHKFTLGIELPKFEVRKKEDFIFQCSRHVTEFNSIEVAQFCIGNKIRGYFAGPIAEGYKLLDYIDNKNTFYLGEISESTKQDFLSRARLCTMMHNWPTPFSLSAIEALAFGTPVACVGFGFWPSLIIEGYNGYYITTNMQLRQAWDASKTVSQRTCYGSVLQYNHFNMMTSLTRCFEEILKVDPEPKVS